MTIRPHPDPATPDATWRDVPVLGFTVAAGNAVLFCLVWLLRDGLTTDYTWGLLLAPVLMGLAGVAVMALWERLLVRVPRLAATLVAGGALLAFVLVLAWWLVEVNAQTRLFTGSTFWLLAVAPVCAGLAWLAHRLLPAARRPVEEPPAALDDDAWARRLAGVLRLRKDLPDARVAEIVRDARARGAAAGRPLAEELGSPESYAAGVQKDRVAAPRRRAWAGHRVRGDHPGHPSPGRGGRGAAQRVGRRVPAGRRRRAGVGVARLPGRRASRPPLRGLRPPRRPAPSPRAGGAPGG
ncbi:hypothetical protein SAMN04487849_11360 [Micrococcus luteus]|uniref:Uncharacterized protein n=1 Tax=Micrococcus luteus TaxID=1270 RepID=A0ABD7M9Z2_MICLU|nr:MULTISPECIES: hypothetical protein [Micrococcus]RNM11964.1 hypothetical protein EFY10_06840 [Micrococcus sp. RIT608]SHL82938.1 hypothetical protein SAMN04487849_11360 [Micrococcus luteus]